MKILGITGVAGSGKTTLATLLANCGWAQTKFATPIKSMLVTLLRCQGVDNVMASRMIDGDLKEVPTNYFGGKTPRYAMQTLGTEWRELISRNLWVDAWKHVITTFPPGAKILVDDLRFHHEFEAIRSLDGKTVRIHRPNNNSLTKASAHISETQTFQIKADLTIINDAHPEKMLDQLSKLVEYWK